MCQQELEATALLDKWHESITLVMQRRDALMQEQQQCEDPEKVQEILDEVQECQAEFLLKTAATTAVLWGLIVEPEQVGWVCVPRQCDAGSWLVSVYLAVGKNWIATCIDAACCIFVRPAG